MKINKLHLQKCISCNGDTEKLDSNQITKNLNELRDWNLNEDNEMIFKKYNFKNFKKTLEFVNIIGEISEKEGHHPDLSFGYGYCIIMLHTHAIKGLSINDFILASKINLINV